MDNARLLVFSLSLNDKLLCLHPFFFLDKPLDWMFCARKSCCIHWGLKKVNIGNESCLWSSTIPKATLMVILQNGNKFLRILGINLKRIFWTSLWYTTSVFDYIEEDVVIFFNSLQMVPSRWKKTTKLFILDAFIYELFLFECGQDIGLWHLPNARNQRHGPQLRRKDWICLLLGKWYYTSLVKMALLQDVVEVLSSVLFSWALSRLTTFQKDTMWCVRVDHFSHHL